MLGIGLQPFPLPIQRIPAHFITYRGIKCILKIRKNTLRIDMRKKEKTRNI